MVKATARLGGTASDVTVARTEHGLMRTIWIPTPVPDEIYFEAIKAGIDAAPEGIKRCLIAVLIDPQGDFYENNSPAANLELLARAFDKYLSYVDKVFLSAKAPLFLLFYS
ncbi:hypothetical protein BDQ17DRAFT_1424724 [Cyathus striatus]|nr:hypothetical protein BDQ17DRAFT_1424724 [Cyathus striatus]